MTLPTPPLASDGNFDEVKSTGVVRRWLTFVFEAFIILIGLALAVVGVVMWQWPAIVGGVALTLTSGMTSLASMRSVQVDTLRARRLDSRGKPATARVIASRERSLGEGQDGVELTIVIEGPEVRAFTTTRRMRPHRAPPVGGSFAVVADPHERIYRVR